MKTFNKILLLVVIVAYCDGSLNAQNAIAVTSNPGAGLHIALNWEAVRGAAGYNIFRKNDGDANFPATPINSTPIVRFSNCFAIQQRLITADSLLWFRIANGLADSVAFDPCMINTLQDTSLKYQRLQVMAQLNMSVAVVTGLGFEDHSVTNGQKYVYRIIAVNAANTQIAEVAAALPVTAGIPQPINPPTNIIAEPGDAMIQVRWLGGIRGNAGYVVERSVSAAGFFRRVNPTLATATIKNHLNGDTIVPNGTGLVDFQRYDTITGKPIGHLVNASMINGPANGVAYFYRIRTVDLFGRPGLPSPVIGPVIPKDTTKPSAPIDVSTNTENILGHVTISWSQVVKDASGHWEQPDSSIRYKVYRFSSTEDPTTTTPLWTTDVSPMPGIRTKDTTDRDPSLRSLYGNKVWWYRVRSIDRAGNLSQYSTAVSATVKDITAPAVVKGVVAKGFERFISLKWGGNTEPDIAGYQVYRSLCHLGSWVECNPRDTCNEWRFYDPSKPGVINTDSVNYTYQDNRYKIANPPKPTGNKLPCPCSGPFVFLGEITKDSLQRAVTAGKDYFEDHSIPEGSPLCYAYWIKAKDSSDNLSGNYPLPSPEERYQIVCERLRDRTPPDPALISGMFAQTDRMRVEWMGPPTQDTRAYHVYRAKGTDPSKEPVVADYRWVGGMTVELPPLAPRILTSPYTPPTLVSCDVISVQATPWMSQGNFEDKTIDPKLTYWYKVVGIDYDGNETSLSKAAAISSFSFTKNVPVAPVIDLLTAQPDPCGVVIQWSPLYDPTIHAGFIVYKSTTAYGPFTPVVVSPVKGNSYIDNAVVKGNVYWYQLGLLMKNGRLSVLSVGKSIVP